MKNYKKIAASIATSAMMLQAAAPMALATEIIVSGNGSHSDQDVVVSDVSTTTVTQHNDTDIKNTINLTGNTGDNDSEDNTGGDNIIETGDATANVLISNTGNTNVAEVESCGDCDQGTSVLISGNGHGTDNDVAVTNVNAVSLFQDNVLNLDNNVKVNLNTGDNESEDNTGGSVVSVTGDADANIGIWNTANANSAMVTGGNGGDVTAVIRGNGSHSDSDVNLALVGSATLTQENHTRILNKVGANLNTGDNETEDNTGGEVGIGTGDAHVDVMVDNAAGFNDLYFDNCGCEDSALVKVAGNGARSDNDIRASLVDDQKVWQNNFCEHLCFDNQIGATATTGDNESEDNTGEADSDPLTITGDSHLSAVVDNMAGANTYGSGHGFGSGLFNDGLNVNVDVSFNLGSLWSSLFGY